MLSKTLCRLSRSSLINLTFKWLDNPTLFHPPYLSGNRSMTEEDEEDYLYVPAEDVESLRSIYVGLENDPEASKRHIIDRIVDGDWRRGLSLHQLAMVDMQYIQEHDSCLRWSALKLVPLGEEEDEDAVPARKRRKLSHQRQQLPGIRPATFLRNLKAEVSSLVKAHYYLHRLSAPYHLTVLRVHITGTAWGRSNRSTADHTCDGARTLYIALPESCSYVYVALSGPSAPSNRRSKKESLSMADISSMKKTILEAVPRAFSRPQQRYALETTKLSARSLQTICAMRGTGRAEKSAGVYSSFAEAKADNSPLESRPTDDDERTDDAEADEAQRDRNAEVQARFGPGIAKARFDRVSVRISDISTSITTNKRKRKNGASDGDGGQIPLSLTLAGSDVFTGLRNLAEAGDTFVDLQRMPAWMTGEKGVSNLVV